MYLSGYLHRDPSLGNALMNPTQLTNGHEIKAFEIPQKFMDHLDSFAAEYQEQVKKIKEQCTEVKSFVTKLGIPAKHCAVITDGDLAVPWMTYFEDERRYAKSVSDFGRLECMT